MKSASQEPVYANGGYIHKKGPRTDTDDNFKGPQADKAIIVMELLRCNKRGNETGVGPNRDDKPIFKQIVEKWDRGESVDSQLLFMARHRVQKYRRQIMGSAWSTAVRDASVSPSRLMEIYKEWAVASGSASLLEQEMMAISDYGNW